MIEKIPRHYSMTTVPTTYDEEALTPLELAGRTAYKVNELVDEVNKLPEAVRKEVAEKILEHIESGLFDQEIDKYNGDLIDRLNNIVASSGNDNTELVDLRLSADRVTYPTAGDAVRAQIRALAVSSEPTGNIRVDKVVDGEYYHNDTGAVTIDNTNNFTRSQTLYPCKAGQIFTLVSQNQLEDTHKVYLACFDKDLTFLGYVSPFGGAMQGITVKCTPPGTVFVGVSIGTQYTGIVELATIDAPKTQMICWPFDGHQKEYIHVHDAFMNGTGTITYEYDTYDVCVFKTEGLASIYTNSTLLYNAIFFDSQGNVISHGEEFTVHGLGRSYTVPGNAVYVGINIPHTGMDEDGYLTAYVALTKKSGDGLNGKRIMCIGDSLTWLDGRAVEDIDTTQMVGWQAQLRARGAIVDNAGFSGAPIATTGSTTGIVDLIKPTLAEKDGFRNYDAVVLFAGRNDMRLATDVDTIGSELSNLVSQINTAVYICTPLYSDLDHSSVGAEYVIALYGCLYEVCETAFATPIDTTYCGINKNTIDKYTYDGVHPNKDGMKLIGNVIAKTMERSM